MKFSLQINQKQALSLGITNINQAHIFDLLTGMSTWAEPVVIDGEVFYWASRQNIASELTLLDMKPDTVYRHLKSLADIGLIIYKKQGKKDCVQLTEKGKTYYAESEPETPISNSEINPNHYVGFKSEFNSDLNPTDQYTNNNTHITRAREGKLISEDFAIDAEVTARLVLSGIGVAVGQFLLDEFVNKNISTGYVSRCWSAEFASYCKRNEWRYRKHEQSKQRGSSKQGVSGQVEEGFTDRLFKYHSSNLQPK